jgi:hypothetical protein
MEEIIAPLSLGIVVVELQHVVFKQPASAMLTYWIMMLTGQAGTTKDSEILLLPEYGDLVALPIAGARGSDPLTGVIDLRNLHTLIDGTVKGLLPPFWGGNFRWTENSGDFS